MTILPYVALWFLSGCVCAGIWALLCAMGRRAERWARAEVIHQNQLDAAYCPSCFRLAGNHADDCEWVVIAGRSREGRL